jgi:hypothetical protein
MNLKVGDRVKLALKEKREYCRMVEAKLILSLDGMYLHLKHEAIVIREATLDREWNRIRNMALTRGGIWIVQWEDGKKNSMWGDALVVVEK